MNFLKIVFGLTALSSILISCGNNQNSSQTTQQAYPTTTVSGQHVELTSVYPITIKGQEVVEIRPRVEGFIVSVNVDEGAVVRKGQSLFKIESPSTEQALRSAEASVKSAQAQVNTAKTNVDRTRPLVEKGIMSQIQLTTAEDSYSTALATLAQAEATLMNAQATSSWTNVLAPVDGLVGEIPYRLGSLVNSSNVITTVANTGNVFAYFSLNEKDLAAFLNKLEGNTQAEKIKNVPAITLTLADGTVYEEKGRLQTISGTINVSTGSANFRVEFPNPKGQLKSGTSGRVSIPTYLDDAILVPQKATFELQDKVLVYVAQGDSVMQRNISVIPTPDSRNYVVTDGLSVGEKVVVDGIATLSHGKKVSFK